MCTISRNKFKRDYLKNKRLFADFLFHFWNVQHLEKKIYPNLMDCERGGYLNV